MATTTNGERCAPTALMKAIAQGRNDYEKFERGLDGASIHCAIHYITGRILSCSVILMCTIFFRPATAKSIYEDCSTKLRTRDFSVHNLFKKMKVDFCVPTDDPTDTLLHHKKIAGNGFEIKVLPTFRPDKATQNNPDVFNEWVNKLQEACNISISTFDHYFEALQNRQRLFRGDGLPGC